MGARAERGIIGAALRGQVDAARRLLREGVSPNHADEKGTTALIAAAAWGHVSVVECLLENGANPNQANALGYTPLMAAARGGWETAAALLLRHGADPNARDREGVTCLMMAAGYAENDPDAAVLRALIGSGANVDARNARRDTALIWAASVGRLEAVRALIDAGASPHLVDEHGRDAIARAEERRHDAVATYLRAQRGE